MLWLPLVGCPEGSCRGANSRALTSACLEAEVEGSLSGDQAGGGSWGAGIARVPWAADAERPAAGAAGAGVIFLREASFTAFSMALSIALCLWRASFSNVLEGFLALGAIGQESLGFLEGPGRDGSEDSPKEKSDRPCLERQVEEVAAILRLQVSL